MLQCSLTMSLPPLVPEQLRMAAEEQPNTFRRIARWWIAIGSLGVLFICIMAVAHFAYDMPLEDRTTGQPSTTANTLMMFSFIGGGGLLFIFMGILLDRRMRD